MKDALIAAAIATIAMKSISYDPKSLTVHAGDQVEWQNASLTDHSATGDGAAPLFDTGMIAPQAKSAAVTFSKPGTYGYHCTMHGRTMSGTIVVTP